LIGRSLAHYKITAAIYSFDEIPGSSFSVIFVRRSGE